MQSDTKIFLRGEREANKLINIKVNSKPEFYNHTIITNSGNNCQWILKPPGKKLGNRKITQSQSVTLLPIYQFYLNLKGKNLLYNGKIIWTLSLP